MVGFTYNEVSRRYVSTAPKFYTPESWRAAPEGSIKQGSGGTHSNSNLWDAVYKERLNDSIMLYNGMLADGVAPEQARMVLPQSMMTSYYVTGSLAAYARMVKQRGDGHAQAEIQVLAAKVASIIAPLYPTSWKALTGGTYE